MLITGFFVKMPEGMFPAAGTGPRSVGGGQFACGGQHGRHISLRDNASRRFGKGLYTAPGPVGDHRRTAGDGLHINRGIVVLPGRIEQDCSLGLECGQGLYVFGPFHYAHPCRHSFFLFFRQFSHQDQLLVFAKQAGHLY